MPSGWVLAGPTLSRTSGPTRPRSPAVGHALEPDRTAPQERFAPQQHPHGWADCGDHQWRPTPLPSVPIAPAEPQPAAGAIVGNTGYFGLPVAIALLPSEALGFSVIYDLIGTLITWSAGPLLLSPDQSRPSALALLKTPVVQALLLALPLGLTPWGTVLGQWLWLPARLVLWLLLLMVGMRLGLVLQRIHPNKESPSPSLQAALAIKLLALPAVMALATSLLHLPELMRQALVLQAAAPTAMSVLLLAEAADAQNGSDQETLPAARLVLWSSGLALISLPLWFQLTAAM